MLLGCTRSLKFRHHLHCASFKVLIIRSTLSQPEFGYHTADEPQRLRRQWPNNRHLNRWWSDDILLQYPLRVVEIVITVCSRISHLCVTAAVERAARLQVGADAKDVWKCGSQVLWMKLSLTHKSVLQLEFCVCWSSSSWRHFARLSDIVEYKFVKSLSYRTRGNSFTTLSQHFRSIIIIHETEYLRSHNASFSVPAQHAIQECYSVLQKQHKWTAKRSFVPIFVCLTTMIDVRYSFGCWLLHRPPLSV